MVRVGLVATFCLVAALLAAGLPGAAAQGLPIQAVSWTIHANGNPSGSAFMADGVLLLQAGPDGRGRDFPYAVAAGDPFPDGDFDMTFQVAYRTLELHGSGLVILSREGHSMFWVWAGVKQGIQTGINGLPWSTDWDHPAQAESGRPFFQVSNGASANTFTFSMRGQTVRLLVDGIERLAWTTPLRPAVMYAGHPTVGQQAGILPDGQVPVLGHVDEDGMVAKRWWGAANHDPPWTPLALTAVEVFLPSVPLEVSCLAAAESCCTSGIPATAAAGGLERARQALGEEGFVDVRVSGHACVTVEKELIQVDGQVGTLGNLLVQMDDATQVEIRASDRDMDLAVDLGVATDTGGLAALPSPLPPSAAQLPPTPDGQPSRLVKALQVDDGPTSPGSVRVAFDVQGMDGARLVVWDGDSWVDAHGRQGGTINGIRVFDVRQDGSNAIAVFDRPGTYALLAGAVSAANREAPLPVLPFVALGLLALALSRRQVR